MKIRTLNDNDEENPDLYVGSGQNVVDGDRRRQNRNPLVQDLLQGAEERAVDEENALVRELVIYRNGFKLHNTFYSHDDEEGKLVLEALKNGKAPLNVLECDQGAQIDLKASQKMNEDYVEPFVAFKGAGNRLGSPVPVRSNNAGENHIDLPNLDESDPENMILQIRKKDGSRVKFVCKKSDSVEVVNSQLQGTLYHSMPRKIVDSLIGCDKELLLLL